ncbi:MAG: Na+:solute symporter [Bdellovibrionales bacterium]|nr:Na+:solute symporter [Bdellovibrionales bacterium]
MELIALDLSILVLYISFVLVVGFIYKNRVNTKKSFFLADRSLPWWWAGISIVATTFAADTPLAITGIIASKGLSGNWLWLAWIGAHSGVAVLFAKCWSRAGTVTDAELIQLRYSGKGRDQLRLFRSLVSGLLINCIVLGWVLKAMVKISSQFFDWELLSPGLYEAVALLWPAGTVLGTASDGITLMLLMALVCLYSSLGGLKGVVLTDLFQFFLALGGSIWLAIKATEKVGGLEKLQSSLVEMGKGDALKLFPTSEMAWIESLEIPFILFGAYLVVQSLTNLNVDGGGYIMQRLNSAKDESQAQKASLVFIFFHYLVRTWPWFIVAFAALVLIPEGNESLHFGESALPASQDRELAYPILMKELLAPGILGLVLTSLVAAFMSTVDTHINWGSSYLVNDWAPKVFPNLSGEDQLKLSRLGIVFFTLAGVFVSFQIETIEQAWKIVAAIGASMGLPTILRWVWWRVNAMGEFTALSVGLTAAFALSQLTNWPYELRLILTFASSGLGMLIGIYFLSPARESEVKEFFLRVSPAGFWPRRSPSQALKSLVQPISQSLLLMTAIIASLSVGQNYFFSDQINMLSIGLALSSLVTFYFSFRLNGPKA